MAAAPPQRVVLVSGAAGGLGAALCRSFAAAGHSVVACDVSDEVTTLADDLRRRGADALGVVGDVGDETWVTSAVSEALAEFGRIDVVVNNAAISPKHDGRKHEIVDMPYDEWSDVLRVNLSGPFLLARACVPGMIERGWGRVISVTSQAGRGRADFAGSHYASSKAGLIGLSRVLAGEVGGTGITVNCVAPGRLRTRMGMVGGEAAMEPYIANTPVRRMGEPEDVVGIIRFLASDEAAFITGATFDVNGGYSML